MKRWHIYEITSKETPIHGVMLRGRLRKFALQREFDFLTENASDKENCVRFAVLDTDVVSNISEYLKTNIEDVSLELISSEILNPVLSKLKVNDESRYTL